MIELDNKIIQKYNKLFDEVAEFYDFGTNDIICGYNGCHIIRIDRLGILSVKIVADYKDALKVQEYVWNHFEYLAPFYDLFYGAFYDKDLGIFTNFFINMNESIKKVREIEAARGNR